VLASLTLASEVEGTIMDFSDSGNVPRAFAVIEIVQKRRVVVPVATLQPADAQSGGKEFE
jgi:hypothetical protein